jgi:hypothetical protein
MNPEEESKLSEKEKKLIKKIRVGPYSNLFPYIVD